MAVVLIARPRAEAEATAERLRAFGYAPLVAPALAMRPRQEPLPQGTFSMVAAASANTVAALRARGDVDALRGLPLLAVGDRTAGAARAAGFSTILSAAGDRHALARLAVSTLPPGGRLLALLGRDHHADWIEEIRAAGRIVVTALVYEVQAAERLPEAAREGLRIGGIDAILHYSARSSRLMLELSARERLGRPFRACLHACLSQAVAEPLREAGVDRIVAARVPEEDALLRALLDALPARLARAGVAERVKLAYNRKHADQPGAAAMTMDDGRSGGRKAGRRREPATIEGQAVPAAASDEAVADASTGTSDRPETPEKSAAESAGVLLAGEPEGAPGEDRAAGSESERTEGAEHIEVSGAVSGPDLSEGRPMTSGVPGAGIGRAAASIADDARTADAGSRTEPASAAATLEPRRQSRLPLIAASLAAGLLGGVAGTAATQYWPGLRQAEAGRDAAVQERVAALETQLNARLAAAAPAAAVTALAQRVEALAPAASLTALSQRIDALAPRVEGQASTQTSTQNEVQRLAAGVAAEVQGLRAGVGQIQELRAGLGQIAELRASLGELQGLRGGVEELRAGVAEARALSGQVGELKAQLTEAQAAGRRALEEVQAAANAPDADEQARAGVAQAQTRLGLAEASIARFDEAQAGVSRQVGRVEGEIGQRVAEVSRGVAELTRRVGEIGPGLAELTRRVDETAPNLAEINRRIGEIGPNLAQVTQRVEEGARSSADLTRRIEEGRQRSVEAAKGLEEATRRLGDADRRLAELSERVGGIDRTIAAGRSLADSAKLLRAQALASQVSRAVEAGGMPFEAEIEALRGLGVADAGRLASLTPLAKGGAPTPASLAQDFTAQRGAVLDVLAKASRREEAPYAERVFSSLGSIVQVRPTTGDQTGGAQGGAGAPSGDGAVLVQRIDAALSRGVLADAAAAWGALPEPARSASRAFGERLRSREAALAAAEALTRSTGDALAKSAS